MFALRNGATVSVIASASAACLIRTKGTETIEDCFTATLVDEGRAISVVDECGATGHNLMEITGLVPAGVSAARLGWSDGHTEDAAATHGAFKFEGTNPSSGASYPIGVNWIKAGKVAGQGAFPVQGDQFCLP